MLILATPRLPRTIGIAATLLVSCSFATRAVAQEEVKWNHKECPNTAAPTSAECNPVRPVTVSDGEIIKVIIENTCPAEFEYTIVRIPRAASGRPQGAAELKDCTTEKGDLQITHDDQFGGYVIHITRVRGNPNVGSARLTISATTAEWDVAFSGGFNLTGLRNRAFALRDTTISTTANGQTTTQTRYRIIEQDDAADEVGRSVASFVHLKHTAHPWVGVTFGIGVDADRSSEYYFGPSFHFGERGSLNFGAVVGTVERLPTGRSVGDLVADANLLSNLADRTVVRWFAGLSFRFLNGNAGDNLKKPFLGRTPIEDTSAGVDRAGGTEARSGTGAGGGETTQPVATKILVDGGGQSVGSGQQPGPVTVTVVGGDNKGVPNYVVDVENIAELTEAVKVTMEDNVTDSEGKVELKVEVLKSGTHTLKVRACSNADSSKCVRENVQVTRTP